MPGARPREQSGAAPPRYERGPDQQEAMRDGTAWVVGAARPDVRSSTLMNDVWLWPVTCRAHETRRADRVLGDPFAPHLAASRGEERFGAQADSLASFALAVGAAIIDEVLQRVVVDYHIHTIAGLGAGLDTRPYRLELPRDLRWIEADRARCSTTKPFAWRTPRRTARCGTSAPTSRGPPDAGMSCRRSPKT